MNNQIHSFQAVHLNSSFFARAHSSRPVKVIGDGPKRLQMFSALLLKQQMAIDSILAGSPEGIPLIFRNLT